MCSNITENFKTSGFAESGIDPPILDPPSLGFKNSLVKTWKIMSEVIPLVNNS